VQVPELRRLRTEVKLARAWLLEKKRAVAAVNEAASSAGGSDRSSSTSSLAQCEDLLLASEFVWLDMSEAVEHLKQVSSLYCICRQPITSAPKAVPAPMVECPSCGLLFHHDCCDFGSAAAQQSPAATIQEAREFRCFDCATREFVADALRAPIATASIARALFRSEPPLVSPGAKNWLEVALSAIDPPLAEDATKLRSAAHLRSLILVGTALPDISAEGHSQPPAAAVSAIGASL
jgi:hypothetical protein